MCIERPAGDSGDWIFQGWHERRVSQFAYPAVGRADLVPNPWELPLVDALFEDDKLDEQTMIVLRDVDAFVLSRDPRFPGRLAVVDMTEAPDEAHVDWIRFAAEVMRAVGYDTVPVLMASNVRTELLDYAFDQAVSAIWWEPVQHLYGWHGPRPAFEVRSGTLIS